MPNFDPDWCFCEGGKAHNVSCGNFHRIGVSGCVRANKEVKNTNANQDRKQSIRKAKG